MATLAAIATVTATLTVPAQASPTSGWDFNSEILGAPPSQASLTQGEVRVVKALTGGPANRAVELMDTSRTTQSKVAFPADSSPARRFRFDLAVTDTRAPAIIVVRGTGETAALGLWRFLITRSSIDGEYTVQAYDGMAWRLLGLVILRERVPSEVLIEASATNAVLEIGDRRLKTSKRASAATAVTGIEFASSGAGAIGTGFEFDNLALKNTAPRGVGVEGTIALSVNPSRDDTLTRQRIATATTQPTAVVADWGDGTGWHPADVAQESGVWTVRDSHTFATRGRFALRVRFTDDAGAVTEVGNVYAVGFPKVLIAQETAPSQIRFPDITRRQDGSLVAAYDASTGHTRVNGVIKIVTSGDNGQTWSAPTLAVQTAYDARDPKITALKNGTLIVSYFETQWNPDGSSIGHGVFTSRSTDGGATWDAPIHVDSAMGSTGTGKDWAATHAPALELPNGDILLALYGVMPGETRWRATVVRSTDGGRHFSRASEVTTAVNDEYRYAEPNLTLLPSGEIVSLIRLELEHVEAQLTRSFDGGHTWSTPVVTDIPARSHHQLLTSSGAILLTYGNPLVGGRPTEGRMVRDPEGSWDGIPATSLYDAGNGDQANPSSIELSPGVYLTLGYDVRSGRLYAVRTTDADYQ